MAIVSWSCHEFFKPSRCVPPLLDVSVQGRFPHLHHLPDPMDMGVWKIRFRDYSGNERAIGRPGEREKVTCAHILCTFGQGFVPFTWIISAFYSHPLVHHCQHPGISCVDWRSWSLNRLWIFDPSKFESIQEKWRFPCSCSAGLTLLIPHFSWLLTYHLFPFSYL